MHYIHFLKATSRSNTSSSVLWLFVLSAMFCKWSRRDLRYSLQIKLSQRLITLSSYNPNKSVTFENREHHFRMYMNFMGQWFESQNLFMNYPDKCLKTCVNKYQTYVKLFLRNSIMNVVNTIDVLVIDSSRTFSSVKLGSFYDSCLLTKKKTRAVFFCKLSLSGHVSWFM